MFLSVSTSLILQVLILVLLSALQRSRDNSSKLVAYELVNYIEIMLFLKIVNEELMITCILISILVKNAKNI